MTALKTSIEQATIAAKAADEKLGRNIAVIDVSDVVGITDIFVIVSADNERQAAAIVEEIEGDLTDAGFEPKRREGNRENRWVLLDYGDIVIHVQRDAERDFYGLDRLYADCPVYEVEGMPPYERDVAFGDLAQQGDSASVRGAERIEDLPLAGEGPASGDDEF
ncbi:ribosome silencing factor [Corynebacterium sanguinis]|uniref:ribosome silencing factor n=1 Tax=Corynebacterium sanguinis TaxID=2594913 RepID=UPI001186405D|nr:ribosome silencing factor [Corynebacterium sanguinis]QDR77759.1 ribosome silencing factor [Corynebacterium sanguinis]TVS27138.1 ribosome silencing factor [Corynebacterium sanguinis]